MCHDGIQKDRGFLLCLEHWGVSPDAFDPRSSSRFPPFECLYMKHIHDEQKVQCSWYQHTQWLHTYSLLLISVAGMLQVPTDELASALTTDIQYFKGKSEFYLCTVPGLLSSREIKKNASFSTRGNCLHGLSANGESVTSLFGPLLLYGNTAMLLGGHSD